MIHFLIAIDLQNDFIDGALGTKEATVIVPAAADKIMRHKGKIIATLDTHGADYLNSAEGKSLPVEHCIKGTKGWQINDEIKAALDEKGCIYVEKPTFGSVRLPEIIKSEASGEPFDITLIGLCTDICVVSNALLLKANFPECDICVDSACCAGVTPDSHNAALTTMKMCQIRVV
ncbi:MAG: cysteine hydrolase family protein [Acutalibacteraceae bacterium]